MTSRVRRSVRWTVFRSNSITGKNDEKKTSLTLHRLVFEWFRLQGSDELILLFGDTDGCVNILIFLAAREIFRLLTTLERRKGIPTVTFDRFLDSYKCDYIRWQVHREWIGTDSLPPFDSIDLSSPLRIHLLRFSIESDYFLFQRPTNCRSHRLYSSECQFGDSID